MQLGYKYDASTLPNFLSPLARTYFLATSNLSKEEKNRRKKLFGKFSDGFKSNKPYNWIGGGNQLLEIPVTTMPVFKIPIHASYITYFSTYNKFLAKAYFQFAIKLCKLNRVNPSILLHPLDFLGDDDITDLSFFPAMKHNSKWKIEILDDVLKILNNQFKLVHMDLFAQDELMNPTLKEKEL